MELMTDIRVSVCPTESRVSETNGSSSDAELNVLQGTETICKNSLVSGGADSKLNEGDLSGENLFVADSEASKSFMGSDQDGKIIAKHTT